MALKKRQPKFRETTEEDSWIAKTWNTPRGRASLKLALYGLLVITVLLLIIVKGSPEQQVYHAVYSEKTYEVSLEDRLEKLKENNFEFNYTIIIDGNKTLFYGQKKKNLESGYKEDNNGILHYLMENDSFYKIGLNGREPISNVYEGFNLNYLNLNFLISSLEGKEYTKENKVYTYNLDNQVVVAITTEGANIANIHIQEATNTYDLDFSKIGKIDTVSID